MIELQANGVNVEANGDVQLSYFGASSFRITSPAGISVLIDPWRNHPSGKWDWYRGDFPVIPVDIVCSTHAHFDHDGVHQPDAHVVLDRPIGEYSFADVKISCIADKHCSKAPPGSFYDWPEMYLKTAGIDARPPNNPRQFDNTIIVIETGGLRIMHWGDNRIDPNPHVWDMLGSVDIALLPIDASMHILSYEQADEIADKLNATVIVPHHYFMWDLVQRGSTLLPADAYVATREHIKTDGPDYAFNTDLLGQWKRKVVHFGENVAFEKPPLADAKSTSQDWG
ncbi:MAG: L-ascorbate metabolism protein UlaG (beta-lactamase superfamily) [Pseudomonadales bacterium]|jgi:L-ascorbate metabolism protein UlaG (beta-lactamase superfamily)